MMLFSAAFYSGLRNQFDYNSQMVLLNSLGSQGLRKLSNLLVEELLGVSPHSRGLAVLEGEERLLETLAKSLTGLTGQH